MLPVGKKDNLNIPLRLRAVSVMSLVAKYAEAKQIPPMITAEKTLTLKEPLAKSSLDFPECLKLLPIKIPATIPTAMLNTGTPIKKPKTHIE